MRKGKQPEEAIQISFTPLESRVTLQQPIFIDVSIYNGLADTISVDFGHNRKCAFDVIVTNSDGSTAQASPLSDWDFGRAGDFAIDASENYRQRLLLNERYLFRAPGNYRVDIKLTTPITDSLGRVVEPRVAPPMTLTVEPRAPAQLEEISHSLAQIAIESTDVEKAMEAGLALSYIIDPIAVPYLTRVLNRSRLAWSEAASGLGRIATDDAVKALVEVLRDPDSLAHEGARSVLHHVMEKTQDPSLKSRIKSALVR